MARHAPKEEPVNCVESQKYTGRIEGVIIVASTYIRCMERMAKLSVFSPSRNGHGHSDPKSGREYPTKA